MVYLVVLALGLFDVRAGEGEPAPVKQDCVADLDPAGALARRFKGLSDDDLALEIVRGYPDMMALTGDVDASPFGLPITDRSKNLASERLFGTAHPEFDRTIAGLLVLKWILNDEYDRLVSVQSEATRLSRARFDEVRAYVARVVHDDASRDAMITSMVINDLGKVKAFVARTRERFGVHDVDHDNVLLAAIENDPSSIAAYARLPEHYRRVIRKGLGTKFNLGQFVQGENVPPSLEGMKSLVNDREALDFFLVHALIDFAGVAGHKTQGGSVLLDEPKTGGYLAGIAALEGLGRGQSPVEVYDGFLNIKARAFGFAPGDRAVTRLATMLGLASADQAAVVKQTFSRLPDNTRAILAHELTVTGYGDQPATLVYYAPALVTNIRLALEKGGASTPEALTTAFRTLARVYHEVRLNRPKAARSFTIMAKALADLGGTDPRAIDRQAFELVPVGDGAELKLTDQAEIDLARLKKIAQLPQPRGRLAFVGVGGGSDAIQASILALMMTGDPTEAPPLIISIRSPRPIQNHGGELAPGVFKITTETSGPNRFLENRAAGEVAMYDVFEREDVTIADQIRAILRVEKGVDHLFAVDTGGDSLHSTVGQAAGKATPDRDVHVMQQMAELNLPVTTLVPAPGIDSPDDATEVLVAAKARYFEPSSDQALFVLAKYKEWRLDGVDGDAFGKTALSWQAALWRKLGRIELPLPTAYVLDRGNPWSPFVWIQPAMRGVFVMTLGDHLRAIGIRRPAELTAEHERQLREARHVGVVEEIFERQLGWRVHLIDNGYAQMLSNPEDPSQRLVLAFTPAGMRLPKVGTRQMEALIAAVRAKESYVFKHARASWARVFELDDHERELLYENRFTVKTLLQRKGWETTVLRQGKVFEHGAGWYDADWVVSARSPDGRVTITVAQDFSGPRRDEIDKIARAMETGQDFTSERATLALESDSDVIPGANPRSNPPSAGKYY